MIHDLVTDLKLIVIESYKTGLVFKLNEIAEEIIMVRIVIFSF